MLFNGIMVTIAAFVLRAPMVEYPGGPHILLIWNQAQKDRFGDLIS